MENQNIYDKIKEMLGSSQHNFSVLEEQIDLALQMEYFEMTKKERKQIDQEAIMEKSDLLYADTFPNDEKKRLLVQLAGLENVESYRTIEKYAQNAGEEMHDWAVLAQQESRMSLESSLLDEKQIFISTGLGGKDSKLRYFVVLLSKNKNELNETQQKIVRNEFDFALKQNKGEMEEMKFAEHFVTMLAVLPLDISIKDVFQRAIDECNELGDFLSSDFLITNVKKFSIEEVKKILKQKSGNEFDIDLLG